MPRIPFGTGRSLTKIAILSALSLRFSSAASHAQMDGGYPNLAPSTMQTYVQSHIGNLSVQSVLGSSGRRGQRRRGQTRSRGKTAGKRQPASSQTPASTIYHPNPAVTRRVIAQFLAWARTQSPNEAAYLKKVFVQHPPVTVWSNAVREDGLKTGDLSDALAAYWILNYLIAHQTAQSTRAQALAVRDQVRTLLANNPRVRTLPSAQRQEMAELWMLNFVVQQGAFGGALKRGDKVMQQKLAQAAVVRFQNEMAIDLRQLKLTDVGFVPHRS